MKKPNQIQLLSALNIILGLFSFIILLPGAGFWFGISFAAVSVILGATGKKSPTKSRQICGIFGIILAVAAAVSYVIIMYTAGYRYIEIL